MPCLQHSFVTEFLVLCQQPPLLSYLSSLIGPLFSQNRQNINTRNANNPVALSHRSLWSLAQASKGRDDPVQQHCTDKHTHAKCAYVAQASVNVVLFFLTFVTCSQISAPCRPWCVTTQWSRWLTLTNRRIVRFPLDTRGTVLWLARTTPSDMPVANQRWVWVCVWTICACVLVLEQHWRPEAAGVILTEVSPFTYSLSPKCPMNPLPLVQVCYVGGRCGGVPVAGARRERVIRLSGALWRAPAAWCHAADRGASLPGKQLQMWVVQPSHSDFPMINKDPKTWNIKGP